MTTMFVAPHNTPDWYEGSVAQTLSLLAQNSLSRVPADLYATIEEAAGRVFIHESYTNDIYRPLPNSQIPIPYDPIFVYTGYKNGLGNLMTITSDEQLYDTPARAAASKHLHGHLCKMLAFIQSKCFDIKLLKDPEMVKHLAATGDIIY
ncbi:hypothetical protein BDV93DRAFT_564002 [Ceratobasidium sp. AG-I]|nr:hypothetical protein BDV93DRAFT_564002 [Ceratobasidium sp. AG-I]